MTGQIKLAFMLFYECFLFPVFELMVLIWLWRQRTRMEKTGR